MGIKRYKPTSPGRRGMTSPTFEEITCTTPEKSLLKPLRKKSGRNNLGRITVRHQGGGHKRRYRIIDFKRDKRGVPAIVATVEYDPNRNARICLLKYVDGEKRYILSPNHIKVGDKVISEDHADIRPGNALPLVNIPDGTWVHAIEMKPGKGAQLARSAGGYAQVMAHEGRYVLLKLPSSELRKVLRECWATIGQVGNTDHSHIKIGKAGRKRWMGIRPTVRGVAMNPVDHPHGGGEGRTSGGRHPVTPWGVPTKGKKTRKKKNVSNQFIVRRRK